MKVRWPSWAPVPNKPTVSVDVKQHSTTLGMLSLICQPDMLDILVLGVCWCI